MSTRRAGPAAALFAIAAALHIHATPAPPSGDLAARAAALVALGPRIEGSAAEASAFDYISDDLRASGLEARASDLGDAVEGCSRSRIVEALVPGTRADELAIVVPVGSWTKQNPGSDPSEGAYGIALALAEASRLEAARRSGHGLPITFRFVFLGAERRGRESPGGDASLGSATWIARQEGRTRLAVLYLNLAAEPGRVALKSAGKGVLAPYWYYSAFVRALGSSGASLDLEGNRLQAYRLGLAADFGPSAPYLAAGIPAVELRGEDFRSSSLSGTWLDLALRSFADSERVGFADTWDRHYFVFQLGGLDLTLREGAYVVFLVVSLAAIACSLLVATVARRQAASIFLRRFPSLFIEILALFAALSLVFLAGKGIAALDAMALGSAQAWRLFPRIFALARVLFSFLLFLAFLSYLVERKILTPNPYFYEFAALVCLAVDALLFSAFDLAASFYFIWALVFVEASLAARRRWATLVAYVFMYAPLLVVSGELAVRPSLSTYGRLIDPGYAGLLALSALTLPFFVFTASPMLFFAKRGAVARKWTATLLAGLALAVEAGALCYAAASSPVSGKGRSDLSASELLDQDSGRYRIEIAGLRRLGAGSVTRGGRTLDYDSPGDRAYLGGEDARKPIDVRESASPFLDRLDDHLVLGFEAAPDSVELSLESPGEMLIYDCNLPVKVAVDGRSAVIYAPESPGTRLGLSLTVPESFGARLIVEARYLSALEPLGSGAGNALADGGLVVRASFYIGKERP